MKNTVHTLIFSICLFLFLTVPARAYYSPERGRWINRDPVAEKGGPSLYGFVAGNPLSRTDTLGLFRDDWMVQKAECECRCVSVSVKYVNGDYYLEPHWYLDHSYEDRFGTRIKVEWTVSGNPSKCKYFQDERGSHFDVTGPVRMTKDGELNPVFQKYDDDMGAGFGFGFNPMAVGNYRMVGRWRVKFRCESSDKPGHFIDRADCADIDVNFSYPPK